MLDLRLGRWEDVLADVERVDAVIVDPPYSERTHSGHDAGVANTCSPGWEDGHGRSERRSHGYGAWTPEDAALFIAHWTTRCSGWIVVMTDHVLAPAYEAAFEAAGWYGFAPLPIIVRASRFRSLGDGPPCWTVWLMVARPRTRGFFAWGALPGWYAGPPERNMQRVGGKPLWLMRAIVRDYSKPGDLVCDPCAGGGTTLLAAAMEGRRAIGAEMDPETHAKATERLAQGYTPDMFTALPELRGEQQSLLGDDV